MIRDDQRLEVERLLADGELTCGQIARRAGVSRTTIWSIVSGRRNQRRRGEDDEDENAEAVSPDWRESPPRRCPGCGGLVYEPCRLCHIRSLPSRAAASMVD